MPRSLLQTAVAELSHDRMAARLKAAVAAHLQDKLQPMDADGTGAGESGEGIFGCEPTGSAMTMYHTVRHVLFCKGRAICVRLTISGQPVA